MAGKFESVKVVDSRIVYDKHGRRIIEDVLEFADGSTREWVYHPGTGDEPGAVAVAAFTEDNKMILTKQYRHPFHKIIHDLPAGGMEDGETPEEAALRELEEETGHTAERLKWIGRFSWAPGTMGGTVEIFFTKSLKLKGSFDSSEIMDIDLVDFEKVLEKVLRGEYIDSALVIATLLISTKKLLYF
ncbi:NUDIX domain-containing protein [Candidatus Bathyarchaeota archaeon]|nr:NUDIX domain-containing protein [Candidatus Bathyarchaeota archaeon]